MTRGARGVFTASLGATILSTIGRTLACAFALAASAQPSPPVKPDPHGDGNVQSTADADYASHMQNGVRLFLSKDFKTAITEFEAAYRATPKASPLLNQALCYKELAQYPKVVDRLELALGKHTASMTEEDRGAAERMLNEAKALLAFVTVKVTPGDASITIDGEPATLGDKPIAVGPGDHEVAAAAPGRLGASKKISVASNDRVTVELDLAVLAGTLRVTAEKATTPIEIDGKIVGRGSFQGDYPPGPHKIRLVGETGTGTALVVTGTLVLVDPTLGVGALPPLPKNEANTKPPSSTSKRGFFGHVNGSVLFPLRHPARFGKLADSVSSGANVGARMGYRVNTYAAFEGLFDYGNVEGPSSGSGNLTYSLSSFRLGPGLRLMSPGDTVRFVGTIGGGLAVHIMGYEDTRATKDDPLCPSGASECSTNGVDFFALTEAGAEVDLEGVLIGLSVAAYFSSTKGMNDEVFGNEKVSVLVEQPYENRVLPMIGPRAYIGYAFW
jgi:hypothetical protein